jgi:periplasmic protein TonB
LAQSPQTAGRFDRLSSTLFLAALAHGVVILGVTFAPLSSTQPKDSPSLNVTLLVDSDEAESKARDAKLLAARNQAGGGDDDSLRATRTLTAAQPRNQQGEPLGADVVDAQVLEPGTPANQLVTRSASDREIEAVPETTDKPSPVPMAAAALLKQAAPDTLAAELDDTVANATHDRSEISAPSTREAAVAAYLVGWRQRVERIGTANFPSEILSGQGATGHPVLEVSIAADGRLTSKHLRRSSGDTRLDQAALKILELAGPFDPLPKALLNEYDELRFTYEWDFTTGAR